MEPSKLRSEASGKEKASPLPLPLAPKSPPMPRLVLPMLSKAVLLPSPPRPTLSRPYGSGDCATHRPQKVCGSLYRSTRRSYRYQRLFPEAFLLGCGDSRGARSSGCETVLSEDLSHVESCDGIEVGNGSRVIARNPGATPGPLVVFKTETRVFVLDGEVADCRFYVGDGSGGFPADARSSRAGLQQT